MLGGVVLAIALSLAVEQASAATKPTCYGDYCSGKNPYQTGCAASGYRWGYANVKAGYSTKYTVGRLELWISRTCATRWARLILWDTPEASGYVFSVVQSDGYKQQHAWQPDEPGTYYTNQIYSRSKCSYARYAGFRTGCTVW